MKTKIAALLIGLLFLGLLAACAAPGGETSPSPTPSQSVEPTPSTPSQVEAPEDGVRLLVFAPAVGSGGVAAWWDLATGALVTEAAPLLTGVSAERLSAWDGESWALATNERVQPAPGADIEVTLLERGDTQTMWGKGYSLEYTGDSCVLVREGARTQIDLTGRPPMDLAEYQLLASDLDGQRLRLLYGFAGGVEQESRMTVGTVDADTGEATWFQAVMPFDVADALTTYNLPAMVVILGDRAYFSARTTLAWLDLNTGEQGDLAEETARLDDFIPGTERSTGMGLTFATVPQGQWGDVLVATTEYRDAQEPTQHYVMYYAIRDNALVGALVVSDTQEGIAAYDAQGNRLAQWPAEVALITFPTLRANGY